MESSKQLIEERYNNKFIWNAKSKKYQTLETP